MSRKQQIKSNLKRKTPLPPQLQKRVQSGAITRSQAAQTARERQTLKAAFGEDWRTQTFGKGGAKGISGSFGRPQVAAARSQALATARAKLNGGVGTSNTLGRTLNSPPPRIGPRKTRKRRLPY